MTVTLCGMMKNEARYIPEWVAYHRALGFDDILIIDNDSEDATPAILAALERAGLCRRMEWATVPRIHNQYAAYRAVLPTLTSEWVSFLDADEFLVLHKHHCVGAFLDSFADDVSLVSINWRIFGSSGIKCYAPEPTFERFLMASPRVHPINRTLKYLARRDAIEIPYTHSAKLKSGRIVDDVGQEIVVDRYTWADVSHKAAQVNHYTIRSHEEFLDKIARSRPSRIYRGLPPMTDEEAAAFLRDHDLNDERDESALISLPFGYRVQREAISAALAGETL